MNKTELFKLTVPKLREEVLKIEGAVGVHGMDKPRLIQILADQFDINIDDSKKKMVNTAPLKMKVKGLRELKLKAKADGEKKRVDILRKKIKRLKRQTRV